MCVQERLGKRPFVTENDCVGLGPGSLEEDDIVMIPEGAEVSYVFRHDKVAAKYVLIGDTYVDGIMDGEFLERSAGLEEFELV